jgi:predicted nuclease with TOPRIM domain
MLVLQSVREEKNKLEEEVLRLQSECKRMKEAMGELKFENQTLLENMQKIQR